MKALIGTGKTHPKIQIQEIPAPTPLKNEALIEVYATSINRGEVRRFQEGGEYYKSGSRPGWDFAGVVLQSAADGTGPKRGDRVAGMLNNSAWSETIAVPTHRLGRIPDQVSFSQAASLPIAGLTAFFALSKGGYLQGKKVLITGASGGVGHFAVQLAKLAGAQVTAIVGNPAKAEPLRKLGASRIITEADRAQNGPTDNSYDLILESVGGSSLARGLTQINPRGTIVSFGHSSDELTTFNIDHFFRRNGASLTGLVIFTEVDRDQSAGRALEAILDLVVQGKLKTEISAEASWADCEALFERFIQREIQGKIILRMR